MKTLINYKVYKNGEEFLKDNKKILHKDITTKMQTAFFDLNASKFQSFDVEHYGFSVSLKEKKLLLLKCAPYNALIYGDRELSAEVAKLVIEYGVTVGNILGEKETVVAFLKEYQKLKPGTIENIHSMSIMALQKLSFSDENHSVFQCTSNDLEGLAVYYRAFYMELFNSDRSLDEIKEMIKGSEQSFYAYKINNTIVSIAAKTRESKDICCISHVYTTPEHRGKGYSARVVSKVCEELLNVKKIPYLYVDNNNPISNHLYLKLGFSYIVDQEQYNFKVIE
ncbi:MAG: GNAT family N-acetyltransferase [Anaeroplasmataceae bacterium]|nr:GNAT family N-acetyltransferase [Anaeroplasmataceae bacterium]